MPIVGLTTNGAALPRIGILRKGGPKPTAGNRPGPDLNYFRFVSDDPEIVGLFRNAYGNQPKQINVYMLFDEVADNFDAWREHWVAGGLKHRCDKNWMTVWQNEDGTYGSEEESGVRRPCPDRDKPDHMKRCKPVGRLSVIIPDLERIATVTVLTTSKHDIMSLQGSLEFAKGAQHGKLAGIPFVLKRVEREVSTPQGNGKRVRAKKNLLVLEPHHRYATALLKNMDITPLLLPAAQMPPVEDSDYDDDELDDSLIDTQTGEIIPPSENHGKAVEEAKPAVVAAPKPEAAQPAEAPKVNWPEIERFANAGKFYEWCNKHFRLTQSAVNRELNIKSPMELADPEDAATRIRGLYGKPPETVEDLPFDEPPPEDGEYDENEVPA